ncbi:MAG: response regulator transcription factor [Bacteroidetes bacterium]|nr:response regulator transcription factor [Bacteroidota bacterium]
MDHPRPPIRTLIVDDEPLGRERIRMLLQDDPDVLLVGECKDGHEAVEAIETQQPDLVFLDVQMPELDGLGVIRSIGVEHMPAVIFVTAYDEYAVHAFEVHALDYLLKPFDVERFVEAFQRAAELIRHRHKADLDRRLARLLDDLQPATKGLQRLMIKTQQRIYFIRTDEVDWIEAAGNYVRLHVGGKTHLLRQTMNALERQLDLDRFLRIHRSTIVNVDRVRDLHRMFNGEYEVRLYDGTTLTLSRGYRSQLDRFAV